MTKPASARPATHVVGWLVINTESPAATAWCGHCGGARTETGAAGAHRVAAGWTGHRANCKGAH
ncbi:hypothetical protein [Streptomyces bohaiensis]|uniref:hypothetical protein n=1 Tax=Streptomyces bohaiensis TaxID=1431344 RepID=UPI003B81B3AC